MKTRQYPLILAIILCSCQTKKEQSIADTIYHNGNIITMTGADEAMPEAIAIKDGNIAMVGSWENAQKWIDEETKMVDLQGKTLLPSFIDPHSHFIYSLGMSDQANCAAPPIGPGDSAKSIVQSLLNLKEEKNIPDDSSRIIMGYGYDDSALKGVLLNRDQLDEAFPHNPALVLHVSLHGAVLNSIALEQFGFTDSTKTPDGGVIVRDSLGRPWGLIMETAFLPIMEQLPKPEGKELVKQLIDGQMMYAREGITTAQEGASHMPDINLLEEGANEKAFFIDIVAFPFITEFDSMFVNHTVEDFGVYKNHLKLGGIKITMDGSPQARTAIFTTKYKTGGPSGEENWYGESLFTQEEVNEMLKEIYDSNLRSNFHANGDSAIDMLIAAHEYASQGDPQKDRRTTIIHSQFVRKDQLEAYKKYNLIPSLYTEHTYFFGDAHIINRGLEQTEFISPMKTAIKMGLKPTNHTDFSVAPLNQMLVVWTAVNRISRNGILLGEEECVTPYEALEAITINAAYQYAEEDTKGSIEVGKLADLVILNDNPITKDPMEIKDITVFETIKEGKSIYKQNTTSP